MNVWLQIISIPCLITIMVNYGINPIERAMDINLPKPFNCAFCLTWWGSLSFFMYQYGITGVLYASISTVIAAQIKFT